MRPRKQPPPEPPEHLSARSKELWRELVRRRADSAERQALLLAGLEDLDRVAVMRELIARDGVMLTSRRSGLSRVHPAVKLETDARRRFVRIWKTLGLNWPAGIGFSA